MASSAGRPPQSGRLDWQSEHLRLESDAFAHLPRTYVTSIISGERVQLPPAPGGVPWELHFHEGLGYVTHDNLDESIWCASLMRFQLYRCASGQIVAQMGDRWETLEEHLVRRRAVSVDVDMSASTHVALHAAVFVAPQNGAHIFWSAPDLIASVGKGTRRAVSCKSKLYHEPWNAWDRWLETLQLKGHLRRSKAYSASNNSASASDDLEQWRVLGYFSMSSFAMMSLLLRFALLPRARGGLRDPEIKESCVLMFSSILSWAGVPGEVHLFAGGADWQPPMLPTGERPVTLWLGADLTVSIGQLKRAMGGIPGAGEASQVLQDTPDSLPLMDFFSLCLSHRCLLPCFKQCMWSIGRKVERAFLDELEYQEGPPAKRMRIERSDDSSRSALTRGIASYFSAAVEVLRGQKVVSFAVDAAEVGGKRRLYGVIGLPSSIACWAFPQVL